MQNGIVSNRKLPDFLELINQKQMKTTERDGSVQYVYEDSDLDDEIWPAKRRGKLILPHVVVAVLVGAVLVFGLIGLFCI